MEAPAAAEGNDFARDFLCSYAGFMWEDYLSPSHVQDVCEHLEAVERGDIKRLILSMPPRHSKILNVGEFFPAWYLGRNPGHKIIYATYGQNMASNVGRKVRNQLSDPQFNKVFPGCNLSYDSTARDWFSTLEGGQYVAVGRGGALTGKGGDIVIVDDIFKDYKEASSKYMRLQVQDWYRSVASTRLQKDGAVILMGTRWHKDDLMGWAIKDLKDQGWTILNMPALDGRGTPLWPEMFNEKALADIRETIGSYFWNSLYMGAPVEAEGNIFKRDNWRIYQVPPQKFDTMIQTWDAAFKDAKSGSFVVGQVWGRIAARYYLIAQTRMKMSFTRTKEEIVRMSIQWPKALTKLIEDKANGPAIIDALKDDVEGIEPVNPEGSKEARAQSVAPLQESGNCYLPDPRSQSWVNEFIDECADFPYSENDDQVDAMSQGLTYLMRETDMIDKYKRLLNM